MQHRDAPAFQEYAAAMLAKVQFRVMPLDARGLLYTLRLECWVNQSLPADRTLLAAALGTDIPERTLEHVLPFFEVHDGWLRCPELDDYRDHLEKRRLAQIEGGKRGASLTNKKRGGRKNKGIEANPAGNPTGNPQLPRRVLSTVQTSTEQRSNQDGVYNFLNSDGTDPLDAALKSPPESCPSCAGEGCRWCKKSKPEKSRVSTG